MDPETQTAESSGAGPEPASAAGSRRRRRWPRIVLAVFLLLVLLLTAAVFVAFSDFAVRRWWLPLGLSMAEDALGGEIAVASVAYDPPGRLLLEGVELRDVAGGVNGSIDAIFADLDIPSLWRAEMPLIRELRVASPDLTLDLAALELPERPEEPYDPDQPLIPVALGEVAVDALSLEVRDQAERRMRLVGADLWLRDFLPDTPSSFTLATQYEVLQPGDTQPSTGGLEAELTLRRDTIPGSIYGQTENLNLSYTGRLGPETTETLNLGAVLALEAYFDLAGTIAAQAEMSTLRDGRPAGEATLRLQRLTPESPRLREVSFFDAQSQIRLEAILDGVTPGIMNPLLALTGDERFTTGTLSAYAVAYETEGVYRTAANLSGANLQLAATERHGLTPPANVRFSETAVWNPEENQLTLAGLSGEFVQGDRLLMELRLDRPLLIAVDPEAAPYVREVRLINVSAPLQPLAPTTDTLATDTVTTDPTLTEVFGPDVAAPDPPAAVADAETTAGEAAPLPPDPPLSMRLIDVTVDDLTPWLGTFQLQDAFPFEAGTISADLELTPVPEARQQYRLTAVADLREMAWRMAENRPPVSPLRFQFNLDARADEFELFTLERMLGSARHEDHLLVEWTADGVLRDEHEGFALDTRLTIPDLPYSGYLLGYLDPTAEFLLDSGSLAATARIAKTSREEPMDVAAEADFENVEIFSYRGEPVTRDGEIVFAGELNSVAERIQLDRLAIALMTPDGDEAGLLQAEGAWPLSTPPPGAPVPPTATGGQIAAQIENLDLTPWLELFGIRPDGDDASPIPANAELVLTVDPAGEIYRLEAEERIGPVELNGD